MHDRSGSDGSGNCDRRGNQIELRKRSLSSGSRRGAPLISPPHPPPCWLRWDTPMDTGPGRSTTQKRQSCIGVSLNFPTPPFLSLNMEEHNKEKPTSLYLQTYGPQELNSVTSCGKLLRCFSVQRWTKIMITEVKIDHWKRLPLTQISSNLS